MKKLFMPLIFLIILLIPLVDLFHPGLPITHDGQDHIARIANFYINLKEGIIIPRWAPNLNWGYGHPILEFLYPLPSYLASFFHWIGISLFDSAKIVFGISMFFSGIAMYLWLSQFVNKKAAMIGGLLYVFAPYRFIDVYVRGDIGESLAFVFMPLVLVSLYKIYNDSKNKTLYIPIGAISLACLILSHNAIALMYMPFILFYVIYLISQAKVKKSIILNSLFIILLGLGLSAFFWIPGLLEAKFTLRNIVTKGVYQGRFVSLFSLLYGPWSYHGNFTTQLGILQWIAYIGTVPLLIFKKISKERIFILITLLYTCIAIFLMLSASDFIWQRIMLLQNFQFPWRFLAATVFTGAVLGAILINAIPKKIENFVIAAALIAMLILNKDYWHAQGFLQRSESFFTGVYDSTTDTGESAPIWSVRFMEHRPKAPIEVIGGNAIVNSIRLSAVKHVYHVNAITNAQLLENTIYFPGWQVLVDNARVAVEFQSAVNRGLITFFVSPGPHTIVVKYTETPLRFVSDLISGVTLGILIVIGIFTMRKGKEKKT